MTREHSRQKPDDSRFISSRNLIAKLARAARGGILTVSNAAAVMDLSRRETAMSLGALARRGWLLRARRGIYCVLPLEAEPGRPTVAEDPWILAREAFSPCYIGGWSAAEHWGLTEQLFRSTLVVTARNFRTSKINVLGSEFRLFRVPHSRITGTTSVWRGRERVTVSDRERTIIDALRRPELCGGFRNLADIMREYGRSAERDFRKLASVARGFANGAAWKRLGYLAEVMWPEEKALAEEARKHLTAGIVKLDPRVLGRGLLIRRWGVWVNTKNDKKA